MGTDATGTFAVGNGFNGVIIRTGAANNRVGTDSDGVSDDLERNVISGQQTFHGVAIREVGTDNNIVAGNFIGTDITGTAALGNNESGVIIHLGASNNLIGGSNPAARNVISGNDVNGVWIMESGTDGNRVQGNYVGTDVTGTVALGNSSHGVHIQDTSAEVTGNVISGNNGDGVHIEGVGNGVLQGTVSVWSADGDATDSVGDNDGTLIGGATFTTGQNGQAFSLDGVDDFVEIPSSEAFNSDSLTLEGWINPDDLSVNRMIASKYDTENLGQGISWVLRVDAGGTLTFVAHETNTHGGGAIFTGTVTDVPVVTTGVWQHVAATFDIATNEVHLYVNGQEVAGSLIPDAQPIAFINDSNTPVRIGTILTTTAGGLTSFFNGGIDEFAFYDRPLTGGEIAGLFAAGGQSKGGSVIAGNFIGLDATGTVDLGNTGDGIEINGSPLNVIGGSTVAERNIISGNLGDGVLITGSASAGNWVAGNYIGTDVTGTVDVGNSFSGVVITNAPNNVIGGSAPGEGNLISGNNQYGIWLSSAESTGNVVQGNKIGTDVTGTIALGNSVDGIYLSNAPNNVIGGSAPGEGNLISANDRGILLSGSAAHDNVVQGNKIGTDVTGTVALGNSINGIVITGAASNNVIGGAALGEGNVISGNLRHGMLLVVGTHDNIVAGNYIGTDVTGTLGLGNVVAGIFINGFNNVIGGPSSVDPVTGKLTGSGNVLSDNRDGIVIHHTQADGNVIEGNFIGTDVTGTAALGNRRYGVEIRAGVESTRIGTDGDGVDDVAERNVISANAFSGVLINGIGADNNIVAGNFIGTDVSGTIDLGNAIHGVQIGGGAQSNVIGTNGDGDGDTAERNVISANTSDAVRIEGTGTNQNVVAGNYIGTDVTGTASLGNTGDGIEINDSPLNVIGGSTVAERNIISGNLGDGVLIIGADSVGNAVQGNFIGTDVTGTLPLGNQGDGIDLRGGAQATVIGTDGNGVADEAEGNVISGNASDGIRIASAQSTVIAGNFIGTDVSGTLALDNGDGIEIQQASTGTVIGTNGDGVADTAERNVISGNRFAGVRIIGAQESLVAGNFIGTDATGTAALGNLDGVVINSGGANNLIGSNGDGSADVQERNVISGNRHGVRILQTGSDNNVIAGNYIGTNVTGTFDLGNAGDGIRIEDGASGNSIGGNAPGTRNVISGNLGNGVIISGVGTDQNVIAGNYIGTDVSGTLALGNGIDGVNISSGAHSNIIGTNGDGVFDVAERNVISNNATNINIIDVGTTGNVVAGNYIGTNAAGTAALTNTGRGVRIAEGASANRVGTDGSNDAFNAAERNLVSGHQSAGIFIAQSDDNVVAGNWVGLDVTGTVVIGNGLGGGDHGISISGGKRNLIGTNADGVADQIEVNVSVGSAVYGVLIADPVAEDNVVAGNLIGTDPTGTIAMPNIFGGVAIANGAVNNTIGGTNPGEGNLISGNTGPGVSVLRINPFGGGSLIPAPNNFIVGNLIGTDVTGTLALANGSDGVYVEEPDTVIGGSIAEAGNVISGNSGNGIHITGAAATNVVVQGNYIGTDITGTVALGNGGNGVLIENGASGIFIGSDGDGVADAAERNIISGNGGNGVLIRDLDTTNNIVAGNFIGTDLTGTIDLGNSFNGVFIDIGAASNTIGTNGDGVGDTAEGNLISGNGSHGIRINGVGADDNVVAGNLIGTDITGQIALGNTLTGVLIQGGASQNVVGTNGDGVGDLAERNVISSNGTQGVHIFGAQTDDNVVAGNLIGTDVTGTAILGNGNIGVFIQNGPKNNIIGTNSDSVSDALERNIISGNELHGVVILGAGTENNRVAGNYVGTNVSGTSALGNLDGVVVSFSAANNFVGTNGDGFGDGGGREPHFRQRKPGRANQ